jgi:hypothetical protein
MMLRSRKAYSGCAIEVSDKGRVHVTFTSLAPHMRLMIQERVTADRGEYEYQGLANRLFVRWYDYKCTVDLASCCKAQRDLRPPKVELHSLQTDTQVDNVVLAKDRYRFSVVNFTNDAPYSGQALCNMIKLRDSGVQVDRMYATVYLHHHTQRTMPLLLQQFQLKGVVMNCVGLSKKYPVRCLSDFVGCDSVEEFELKYCEGSSIPNLCELHILKKLTVKYCRQIEDLFEVCEQLKFLTHLTVGYNTQNVDDDAALELPQLHVTVVGKRRTGY